MAETVPRASRRSLAARLTGGAGRRARAVAQAAGIDEAVEAATEEAIVGALESPAVQRAIARVVEQAIDEEVVARVLESPAVERAVVQALDSELVDRVWERILASDEAQKLVERIAEAPEVRGAIAMQGVGVVEDLGRQIARVTAGLDYAVERVVRLLLQRPRRTEPTSDAGLVTRGFALAFDAGLLNVAFVATAALVALVFGTGDGASGQAVAFGVGAWVIGMSSYLLFFWTLAGQTPGMRLLGLRLDRGDGGRRLSFRQAIRRLAGAVLSVAVLGVGFFAVLTSERRQGWHDRIAGTEVVGDDTRLAAPWSEPAGEP